MVENGLFLGICDRVIVGAPDGAVEVRGRDGSASRGAVDLDDPFFAAVAGEPAARAGVERCDPSP